MLICLIAGILSPVTKLSAGRQYYHLLARQVADLLHDQNRIQRLGGVVSLTDLYCLYNRARGTELVSPDDLLQAVRLMESLHLGKSGTLHCLHSFCFILLLTVLSSIMPACFCQSGGLPYMYLLNFYVQV